MGKVVVVLVVLVVLAFAVGLALRRRERATELFVIEATGRQPVEDQVRALEAKDAVEEVERTDRLPGGVRSVAPPRTRL